MIATGGGVGVGVGRTGTDGVGVRAGVGVASAGVGLRSGVEEAARVGVAEAVGEGVASPPPVQAARRRAVARRGVKGRWRGMGSNSSRRLPMERMLGRRGSGVLHEAALGRGRDCRRQEFVRCAYVPDR